MAAAVMGRAAAGRAAGERVAAARGMAGEMDMSEEAGSAAMQHGESGAAVRCGRLWVDTV